MGIAACHRTAAEVASTNWQLILTLYEQLVKLNGSPIVALNRTVAVTRVHGSQAGLDVLDAIPARSSLESYHIYHAVRGTLAAEIGRKAEAIECFGKAESFVMLPSEREFIAPRIREFQEWKQP